MNSPKKILLLSLSGIGNFIMQSPVFTAIKQAHPDWEVTCWVAPRGTRALALNDPHLDHVIEMPIKNSLAGHLKTRRTLKRQHYDIALVLSPGQHLKSALMLYGAGIPIRLGHQYPAFNSTNSQLFLTHSITEESGLHDLAQNLNLLQLVNNNISPPARGGVRGGGSNDESAVNYVIKIPSNAEQAAAWIINSLDISDSTPLVAIHPGAAPGFNWKRWPLNNYAEVAQHLISQYQAHILIFGGPDELTLKQELQQKIGAEHSSIITTNLLTAAALMQRTLIVISNDSGLMHLAAASGATTLGIFGPTDEHLTGPRGRDSHTIRANDTKPVYHTESQANLGSDSHPTLTVLDTQAVITKLSSII